MQLVAEAQRKAEPQEAWWQAEAPKETLTTQFAGSRLFGDTMPAAEAQPTAEPQEAWGKAAAPNNTLTSHYAGSWFSGDIMIVAEVQPKFELKRASGSTRQFRVQINSSRNLQDI